MKSNTLQRTQPPRAGQARGTGTGMVRLDPHPPMVQPDTSAPMPTNESLDTGSDHPMDLGSPSLDLDFGDDIYTRGLRQWHLNTGGTVVFNYIPDDQYSPDIGQRHEDSRGPSSPTLDGPPGDSQLPPTDSLGRASTSLTNMHGQPAGMEGDFDPMIAAATLQATLHGRWSALIPPAPMLGTDPLEHSTIGRTVDGTDSAPWLTPSPMLPKRARSSLYGTPTFRIQSPQDRRYVDGAPPGQYLGCHPIAGDIDKLPEIDGPPHAPTPLPAICRFRQPAQPVHTMITISPEEVRRKRS